RAWPRRRSEQHHPQRSEFLRYRFATRCDIANACHDVELRPIARRLLGRSGRAAHEQWIELRHAVAASDRRLAYAPIHRRHRTLARPTVHESAAERERVRTDSARQVLLFVLLATRTALEQSSGFAQH